MSSASHFDLHRLDTNTMRALVAAATAAVWCTTATADSPLPIAFDPLLECAVYKLAHEFGSVVQVCPAPPPVAMAPTARFARLRSPR